MLQGTVRRVDGFATVAPECEARPVAKGEPESPGSLPEASRNLCLGGRERFEYRAELGNGSSMAGRPVRVCGQP